MVIIVCSTCKSDKVGLIETHPKRPLLQCQNEECKDFQTPFILSNENLMDYLKRR